MLVEQAFMALPEFLVGAPYLKYEHEGTLVMAYSMALLQELNGRNVNNPVSVIRGEVEYLQGAGNRADLALNLNACGIATDSLAHYGYKVPVWVEAKFSRKSAVTGNNVTPSTTGTMRVIADLIRLCCLPPEVPGTNLKQGRYLLHAYQGRVFDYLGARKSRSPARAAANGRPALLARPAFEREWARSLVAPGRATLRGFRTAWECNGFDAEVGRNLRGIGLQVDVTNFVHEPVPVTADNYTLVLTRIEGFIVSVEIDGTVHVIRCRHGNQLAERPAGAFEAIRNFVSANLRS